MEISKEQLQKIAGLVGETELKKIIPEAFLPVYDNNKIYIYDNRYKLHKLQGSDFAFIDLNSTNCWSNGKSTADALIKHAGSRLKVYDNYQEWIKDAYKNL